MKDLVDALRSLDYSNLPDDFNVTLNGNASAIAHLNGGRVLLDRIDELAHNELFIPSGRLQGQPDYYNHEVLKAEGYEVMIDDQGDGLFTGVIQTKKGRIVFE